MNSVAETLPPVESPASHTRNQPEPHLILRPTSGWAALNLKQIWMYRDLLLTLAGRDVKLRYRQTALGVIWVVAQPLIAALIFAFIFGRVAGLTPAGINPLVFGYAGMIAWNAFSTVITRSSTVLIQNSNLISKVFFPRLVLPTSTVFSALLDFAVSLGPMFLLMAIYRVTPGIQILFMPFILAALLMLALGVGLFASAIMVSYRDVQYVVPVAIQLLTFACPIGYATEKVLAKIPEQFHFLYFLNPLVSMLEAFRWTVLGGTSPQVGPLLYSVIFSALVFIGGAFSFKKMERKFADVI